MKEIEYRQISGKKIGQQMSTWITFDLINKGLLGLQSTFTTPMNHFYTSSIKAMAIYIDFTHGPLQLML